MSRVYEFAIKLQDMFTPQMQRMAGMYDRSVGNMSRIWDRFKGMINSSAQTVDKLRQKLTGLSSGTKIKVDSSDLDKAERKASGLMSRVRSFLGGSMMGGALLGGVIGGGLSGLASGAVSMISNQMSVMSDKTLGAAQGNETTRFSLGELMGKNASDALVKKIDAYSPERRQGLIQGATKLSGAGVESSKLMDSLRALNNISAITGESVSDLAMIQAKIKATGYVQGDEINMFKERGINLNPYLAKVMGAGENDIAKLQSKGLITYDIFDKAMQAYAGKGGRFDGAYERYRDNTTQGQEDYVRGKMDAILMKWGEKILPIKKNIIDLISQIVDGRGAVGSSFRTMIDGVKDFGTGIYNVLVNMGVFNPKLSIMENISSSLAFTFRVLGDVFSVAGKALQWLADNPLARAVLGMGALVRLLPLVGKGMMAVNTAFLSTPLGVIAALGLGFVTAYEKFEIFRNAVIDGWEGLKVFFSGIGTAMEMIVTRNWAGLIAWSKALDLEAEKRGKMAIIADRRDRNGVATRRKGRSAGGAGHDGAGGDPFGLNGSGKPVSPAEAAGLNASVSGSKSSNITINIRSLVERLEINAKEAGMGFEEMEKVVIDILLRAANSAATMVTS